MLATPGAAQGSTMGVWGTAPDGTVVVTPGAASGADYGAALRAVAESNGCARTGHSKATALWSRSQVLRH